MMRGIEIYMLSVALAAFIHGCAETPENRHESDHKTLAGCSDRPNCVSSEAVDPRHIILPFGLMTDPMTGWKAIRQVIDTLPRTTLVHATDHYLHAECKSRLFGFIDDLELQLNPETGLIAVRSASRVGYYDMGVNRRRVEKLRQTLKQNGIIR